MASSSRFFRQAFRFARDVKNNSARVQKLSGTLHVTSATSRKFSQTQLLRPIASASGLLSGQVKFNMKTKLQCVPQVENGSMQTRSVGALSSVVQASDDCSTSSPEGSDSSCEAMEGPHGDDDGLVINVWTTQEDL